MRDNKYGPVKFASALLGNWTTCFLVGNTKAWQLATSSAVSTIASLLRSMSQMQNAAPSRVSGKATGAIVRRNSEAMDTNTVALTSQRWSNVRGARQQQAVLLLGTGERHARTCYKRDNVMLELTVA